MFRLVCAHTAVRLVQFIDTASRPHYCGSQTVNRALHLPPSYKNKSVLQQRLFFTLEPKYYAF